MKNLLNKPPKPSNPKQNSYTEKNLKSNNRKTTKRPESAKNADESKSPEVKRQKNNDYITKKDICKQLGIFNPETEHQLDLNNCFSYNANGRPKSKNEITNDVICNLEKEIEKLKYIRDNYLVVSTS